MNIGEVVSLLEAEFPNVTLSKLRFFESQGLVRPSRTPSGYRRYEASDVARITRVLRLQRDQHLPLKVIAGVLDEGGPSDGEVSETNALRTRTTLSSSVSVSRGELAAMVGLDEDTVAGLERLGLISGRAAGTSTVYDDGAVLVGRAAACFVEHGFDVRHLRMYLVAAQREAGLLEQAVGPVASGAKDGHGRSVSEARRLIDELVDAGSTLHELLLRRELGTVGR
jgi:DNA-binding transcriptional MerR regulator